GGGGGSTYSPSPTPTPEVDDWSGDDHTDDNWTADGHADDWSGDDHTDDWSGDDHADDWTGDDHADGQWNGDGHDDDQWTGDAYNSNEVWADDGHWETNSLQSSTANGSASSHANGKAKFWGIGAMLAAMGVGLCAFLTCKNKRKSDELSEELVEASHVEDLGDDVESSVQEENPPVKDITVVNGDGSISSGIELVSVSSKQDSKKSRGASIRSALSRGGKSFRSKFGRKSARQVDAVPEDVPQMEYEAPPAEEEEAPLSAPSSPPPAEEEMANEEASNAGSKASGSGSAAGSKAGGGGSKASGEGGGSGGGSSSSEEDGGVIV
ncbi:hypothetical protein ACHAWF_003988, partial [Thalassiosira exigua]